MLLINSASAIPKKIANHRYCLVLSRRPLNITSSRHHNKINLDLCVIPLPTGGTTYLSDLNKKLPEGNKRFRYVGYSTQRDCVPSINTLEATQLNERLIKAANLYDGWFSRDVESLDLAPTTSNISFSRRGNI